MDHSVYAEIAQAEDRHWWYVARRRIIDSLLARLPLARDSQVLEIGCRTGGNLQVLARYGTLFAAEREPEARHFALRRNVTAHVEPCDLPQHFPGDGRKYDLIAMFDVLEHIEDDVAALKAVRQHMKDKGWLVVTVPAFPFLWSAHDVRAHHLRRYTCRNLAERLRQAGFEPVYQSYFNFWLFPLVALFRLAKNLAFGLDRSAPGDMTVPQQPINGLLTAILASERWMIGRIRLPFGVSCIMSARAAAS